VWRTPRSKGIKEEETDQAECGESENPLGKHRKSTWGPTGKKAERKTKPVPTEPYRKTGRRKDLEKRSQEARTSRRKRGG